MRGYIVAAALAALGSAASAADPSVACTGGVVNCAAAFDGVLPNDWEDWTSRAAFWEGSAERVTVSLGALYTISDLDVVVDNNDNYVFEYSLDGANWTFLGQVLSSQGAVGFGQEYFHSAAIDPFGYSPTLDFSNVQARFVRGRGTGGDGLYSIGEIMFTGQLAPVPEPASLALMGLGVAALLARRRFLR